MTLIQIPTSRRTLLTSLGVAAAWLPAARSYAEIVQTYKYESRFYRIEICGAPPFIRYFSVDALGRGKTSRNVIAESGAKPTHRVEKRSGGCALYKLEVTKGPPDWIIRFSEKALSFKSARRANVASIGFEVDPVASHATLLGLCADNLQTQLPALLHFPDLGSMQLTASSSPQRVGFDAHRDQGSGSSGKPASRSLITVSLPPGSDYTLAMHMVHPKSKTVDVPKYDGFRRSYINLFQINPRLRVLANNAASDPCAFTLYLAAMMAERTPPLAPGLRALDLVRMSVDRYLAGMKSYGLVGYTDNYEGADTIAWTSPYDSLDSYPSLVIAAATYARASGDRPWAKRNYDGIKAWMSKQIARDGDHDGLVEYEQTGNAGSWGNGNRPANWWDTIGFGHKDAYSNALTYHALGMMAGLAKILGKSADVAVYQASADALKAAYFPTFYNQESQVLGGWRSADGKLHDYYFIFINAMAVLYDLVPAEKQRPIMAALLKKMADVGYVNFQYGLPGNLIPIRREDYTVAEKRWGGPTAEDGSDAFQIYENGGATPCFAYFFLAALRKTGLQDMYRKVSDAMLQGYAAGSYQFRCANGMSTDWRKWDGECWGYEGFLADGYLPLLAIAEELDVR